MARIEKTVFISYRRVDRWPALAVFKDLTQHGYDVFIDYDGIASGDFERAIVDNIRARAHFIVVLTPSALERCDDPTDWLRREIEVALEARRNLVPLLFDDFRFDAPMAVQRLQGSLEALRRYQALRVPEDFFDSAMERLRSKHLAVAVEAVLHSPSPHAQQVAHEQHDAASKATALAPAEEKIVAYTAAATSPQRAYGQRVATNEGQAVRPAPIDGVSAAATAVPAHANPHVRLVGLLAVALSALVVLWFVVNSMALPLWAGPTDAAAQVELGNDYYYGRNGRWQNDAEALKWYRKSAEQGNAIAQALLGFMYEKGRGGAAQDDAEAVKWYRKSAEQGNATGQALLGSMYEMGGGGLTGDRAQALMLYRQAAARGDAYAKERLKSMGEN